MFKSIALTVLIVAIGFVIAPEPFPFAQQSEDRPAYDLAVTSIQHGQHLRPIPSSTFAKAESTIRGLHETKQGRKFLNDVVFRSVREEAAAKYGTQSNAAQVNANMQAQNVLRRSPGRQPEGKLEVAARPSRRQSKSGRAPKPKKARISVLDTGFTHDSRREVVLGEPSSGQGKAKSKGVKVEAV